MMTHFGINSSQFLTLFGSLIGLHWATTRGHRTLHNNNEENALAEYASVVQEA